MSHGSLYRGPRGNAVHTELDELTGDTFTLGQYRRHRVELDHELDVDEGQADDETTST